ncbi:hypothetical protein Tco_0666760 [Tanacetum coccineum]
MKCVNTALHNYFDAQSVTAVDTSPSRVSQMSKKKKKGDDAPGQKACETQVVNFDDDIEDMDFTDTIENNETQLYNDCDTEEVLHTHNEGTEVLGVSDDEETDDDSSNRLCKNAKMEN